MKQLSHISLALLVIIPLVLSFIVGIAFWHWYILGIKIVPIDVQVTNESLLGFNADTDALHFGTLSARGSGTRKTTVVTAERAVVVIKTEGAAGKWVRVSENNILIEPNERHDIIFELTVPEGTSPGAYNGTATITYHRPVSSFK
jgi:hypothetical protein